MTLPELPPLPEGWKWGIYKHLGDGHTIDGYTVNASHLQKGRATRFIDLDKLTGEASASGVLNKTFWDIQDSVEILERQFEYRDDKHRVATELAIWFEDHLTPNGG